MTAERNMVDPFIATVVAHVRSARPELANATPAECVIRWHRANVTRETKREAFRKDADERRVERIREREREECEKNLSLPGVDFDGEQAKEMAALVTYSADDFTRHYSLAPSQRQQELFPIGGSR